MKSWVKIIGATTFISIVGLVLSGCASSRAGSKVLQIPMVDSISTMDQSMVTDPNSMTVLLNVESGLTRLDNDKATLDLAKSISTSKDGKTVTVKLRPNLKWSNGDKLTAQDFVYAWQRGDDPKTNSQYAYMLAYVKNGEAVNKGKMPTSALGVKADSETQLTIQLENPAPYFSSILTLPIYFPEDQKVVEKYGKDYGTSSEKMVYDGAFYFKSGTSGQWTGTNNNYTTEKNPSYWDSKDVKSTKMSFQVVKQPTTAYNLYKQNKLDYVPVNTPDLYTAHKKDSDFKNLPMSEVEYIEFNQSGKNASSPEAAKALQNQDIRAALTLATDRKGVINVANPSYKPATSFTPTGTATINGMDFTTYAKQKNYRYDPIMAKKLFQKGLKELGMSHLTLNFEVNSDVTAGKNYGDYLQKSFDSTLPDLTINEKLVPFQQVEKDEQNGTFDLADSIWMADYPDPSTYLRLFVPGSGYNDGRFNNKLYDTAITKATTEPDVLNKSSYFEDYKDAEKALADNYNIDPVMFYSSPTLISPSLKGVVWNAASLPDLHSAYVK